MQYVVIIPGVSFQVNVFCQVVHLYGPFLPNSLIHSATIFLLQPFPRRKRVSCKHSLSPKSLAQSSLRIFFFDHLGIGQKTSPLIRTTKHPFLPIILPEICMPKKLKIIERAFLCFFFIDRIAQLFYYCSHYPKELFAIGDQLKLLSFRQTITNMSYNFLRSLLICFIVRNALIRRMRLKFGH